jgi:large subunit ribosomal protein L25
MENIVLEKRKLTGKKCKKLIREGFVPCVIYNSKTESTNCKVNRGDAERLVQNVTSSTMLNVDLDGKKMKAFVKDTTTDPRNDSIKHISFFEIDEKAELTLDIPFELVGISPAVKNNLGVLIQPTKSISVKAKSKDIVPHIEVDISGLENIGDAIVLEDIEMPSGIELFNPEDIHNTLVTITDLQKQVEEEVEEIEEEEETGEEEGEATEGAEETTSEAPKEEEKKE